MTAHKCPNCDKPLPRVLIWKTLFAGQTAHACPTCGKKFRLTYSAKIRIAYMNVILLLGFIILWNIPDVLRNLAVYGVIASVILLILPSQARYEKTSARYH
jgi:CXXC-20-CXXC protein